MAVFEVGQTASYGVHTGVIRFVDEAYITLSIGPGGPSDVKIIVFPQDYDQVNLLHEK